MSNKNRHESSGPTPAVPRKSALRYSKDSVEVIGPESRHMSIQSRPSILNASDKVVEDENDSEADDVFVDVPTDDPPEEPLARPISGYSRRSYISNLSLINRKNLARFGISKMIFLLSNTLLTFLGLSVSLFGVFTLINQYTSASFMRLIRVDILFLVTVTSGLAACVGMIGFLGAFMHRKRIISIHSLLLWPILAGLIVTGYMSYNQLNNAKWNNYLSDKWVGIGDQKAVVQDRYSCCGFYSSLDRPLGMGHCLIPQFPDSAAASPSQPQQRMRSRAKRQTAIAAEIPTQPVIDPAAKAGCYKPWNSFATSFLRTIYISAFSCIPLVLFVFIVGLLAANHIYD
ncbi:hypothetical protein PhCBS80983_g03809 [Powellomyces hirtus]|uniref:Tetraspanin Tsp2 n=1 Tax=Powellomyces hirtus TaxID=109895 RepID=A0A507E057_9FUNG|nr:hypothetical protein PhCBS80983_g03809 [Powellomyces hirtus]